MKKRIISIICALVMGISTIQPVIADDTFNLNVELSALSAEFNEHFSEFSISSDAHNTATGYTLTQKNMIILEAYHQGFTSFQDLDAKVTAAAAKLLEKENEAVGYDHSNTNYWRVPTANNIPPAETDTADVFKIGGKEFIVLNYDKTNKVFYVITKDYYATARIDSYKKGIWHYGTGHNGFDYILPYKLTNSMAFGKYSVNSTSYNLPNSILKHLDVLHKWDIEKSEGTKNSEGTSVASTIVSPISLISVTEFLKYSDKIGKDGNYDYFWTRTPVSGSIELFYAVKVNATSTDKVFEKMSADKFRNLRPTFYLKDSFFKQETLEFCGTNVASYLENEGILDENKFKSKYESNRYDVFEQLEVTPKELEGLTLVGETLTADYYYPEEKPLKLANMEYVWERKHVNGSEWETIQGVNSDTYVVRSEDIGYYIRVGFKPTFNSYMIPEGKITYAEKQEEICTKEQIRQAANDVAAATTVTELINLLSVTHKNKFKLDCSEEVFSQEAREIFINDTTELNSVADVQLLYNKSIALDSFVKETDADSHKQIADTEYLLGGLAEYGKLTSDAQKVNVVSSLHQIVEDASSVEKSNLEAFFDSAKKIIRLERFNNADRSTVVSIIKDYYNEIKGEDIPYDITDYHLELAGIYIVGKYYGNNPDDTTLMEAAIDEGIREARKVTLPDRPVEDDTKDYPNGGYVAPSTQQPQASGVTPVNAFIDIANVPWGVAAINSLAQKGILSGNGDGTFSPDRLVTRNEFVKMIVMAFEMEVADGELSYEDIDNNSWSAKYIKTAVDAGIINGIDETHFGDGMNISRQDVAVIAERLMQYMGLEMKSSSLSFKDSNEISEYAISAVAKVTYSGIMNGLDGNLFAPKNGTTRAQAAVVVYNLMNYYKKQTQAEEESSGDVAMRSSNDKYDLVFALGILKDEYDTDFKISRGELAAVMSAFGKYDFMNYEAEFNDVNSAYKYSKEIEAVYRNNIMGPVVPKMFMPDQIATYGEAYDAVIAASGHRDLPGGSYEAENALRREPIYAHESDELTSDTLKRLIFAALDIPVLNLVDKNTSVIGEKNILNAKFDVYKARGIVNAAAGISLGGRDELSEDKMIITVDSKDYLYTVNNADYSDYLGYEVTYYYKEIDDSYEIVYMLASESRNSPVRLSFAQITDASNDLTSITYELGNKTKEAKISKYADFIYNGRKCYAISKADLTPNNGYITLIDTNNDNVYEAVRIENYEYIMVAQVDVSGRSFLDRFTWNTYSFQEGIDADKINITKNGRYIKLDYISVGDILAIERSRDNKLINVYVSDKKVSGNIRKVSPSDYVINIDGNTFKTVKDFNFTGLSTGMNVTVGIDWNGYAVGGYAELANSGVSYGYMFKVSPDEEEVDTRIVQMLTQDNEYVKLWTSEKLIKDGVKAEQTALDVLSPQLIAYTLDSTGKIKRIYTSNTESGVANSQTEPLVLNKKYDGNAPIVVYNSFGMTLDFEYNLLSKAIMFNITIDEGIVNKEKSYVTNVGAKAIAASSEPEKFYIYNSDISRVSELCVYEHATKAGNVGFSESFNTQAFILSEVSEEYNDDSGISEIMFKGYHDGKEVEYKFADGLMQEINISKIKSGDVLLIWLSGNEITRFRRLFTFKKSDAYSDVTDVLCNYGDHIYDGSDLPRPSGNYDYKFNWALHIIERAEGRNDDTLSAGTRFMTAYGKIEFVYKSEFYKYPVIKYKVAGKSEAMAYTMNSSTKVYVYNKKNKTIKTLDSNSLSFSNKNAVLTARYGDVRDVIIYED